MNKHKTLSNIERKKRLEETIKYMENSEVRFNLIIIENLKRQLNELNKEIEEEKTKYRLNEVKR